MNDALTPVGGKSFDDLKQTNDHGAAIRRSTGRPFCQCRQYGPPWLRERPRRLRG